MVNWNAIEVLLALLLGGIVILLLLADVYAAVRMRFHRRKGA